jgi:lipopolysaccharide biosynthesis protein
MGSDELHKKYGTAAQIFQPEERTKRLCLFAGYSGTRTVDDYVVYYVEHLSRHSDVYYFADSDMPEQELAKLDPFVKGRWAGRHEKYDFGSWQKLIHILGWSEVEKYDALILANDSNYGPVTDLANLFRSMDPRGLDFWGITQNNGVHVHVQSYFINLCRNVFVSEEFREFISGISKQKTKVDICIKYEIGLSKLLHEKGLSFGVYIDRAKTDVPFGADISAFQNTLIRSGSPFVKRKVFFDGSFAEENVSETWELLKGCGYPASLISDDIRNKAAVESNVQSAERMFSASPVAAGAVG